MFNLPLSSSSFTPRIPLLIVLPALLSAAVPAEPAAPSPAPAGQAVQLASIEVREKRVDGLINQGLLPVDIDAPLPFNIVTRQEIERMGATNLEEVFRNTPEITTYGTPNQEASVVQIVGSSSLSSNL